MRLDFTWNTTIQLTDSQVVHWYLPEPPGWTSPTVGGVIFQLNNCFGGGGIDLSLSQALIFHYTMFQ